MSDLGFARLLIAILLGIVITLVVIRRKDNPITTAAPQMYAALVMIRVMLEMGGNPVPILEDVLAKIEERR